MPSTIIIGNTGISVKLPDGIRDTNISVLLPEMPQKHNKMKSVKKPDVFGIENHFFIRFRLFCADKQKQSGRSCRASVLSVSRKLLFREYLFFYFLTLIVIYLNCIVFISYFVAISPCRL
jgi:hypothetical protein